MQADGLLVDWDGHTRQGWEEGLALAGRSALQQGWAYGEALAAGGARLHRALVRDGQKRRPLALAQLVERRLLPGVPLLFLLRGPVWLDPSARAAAEPVLLHALGRRFGRCCLLVWTPELAGPCAAVHGRRPVMTAYSTGWVDLAPDEALLRTRLHGKWRNQLRRAEEERRLRLAEVQGGELLSWLLRENERHRRRVGYQGPRPAFLAALAEGAARGRDLLALIASDGSVPVAGVLLVRHGAAATYEVGYTSPRGRELLAKHLLLWRAMLDLKRRRVRWLDLGGLNTDKAPGVARFKLGLGCEVGTLAGTFVLRPGR